MTMRSHERAQHSHEPQPARPRSGPSTAGGPDAARILALQRSAGNTAVSSLLSGQTVPVQRAGQSATEREQALSARYGIRIGPAGAGGEHFSHALLNRIESALNQLPIGDLRDNDHLVAIEIDPNPEGSATLYDPNTRSVGVVRPVIAGSMRAPQWLYAALNTSSSTQRRLMDRGLLGDYAGVSEAGDRALGIGASDRQVVGAQGNLVKWTLRHEVGHSVDENAGWDANLARQEHFGRWESYGFSQLETVAIAMLRKARLHDVLAGDEQTLAVRILANFLDSERVRGKLAREGHAGFAGYLERFRQHLPPQDFTARTAILDRFVRLAVAEPWSLADGGAASIEVDGLVYQLDAYGTWVSYSVVQRQYLISRYQFSSSKEWFAEAYSAYYNTKQPELRARLNPQVQQWFATR